LELICAKVLLPGADDSTQGVHARLDRVERRMTLGAPPADADHTVSPVPTTAQPSPQPAAPADIPPPPSRVEHPSPESSRASARRAVAPPGSSGDDGATRSAAPQAAADPAAGSAEGRASRTPAPVEAPTSPAAPASEPTSAGRSTPVSEPPSDGQAAGQAGGVGGQIGLADVRRLWPDILQRVKERKKVTWVMLSQNAQVLAMDDTTLTIGLSHAGVRDNFVRSGHDDILREAMREELLVDRRIEAVVDPSTGGGSAAPGSPPTGGSTGPGVPAPSDASWDRPPEADAPASPPSASAPDRGPTDSAGPTVATGNAEGTGATAPGPGPDRADEADVVGEDDLLLEDDSRSHTELLGQVLGARVIDEQPSA
jgi:DNA polymerase-3 subunit gamma/tau